MSSVDRQLVTRSGQSYPIEVFREDNIRYGLKPLKCLNKRKLFVNGRLELLERTLVNFDKSKAEAIFGK